ncbi:MAG TPA: type II toxin-antitoxin system VapC family toxin, partial [Nitrososphaera sp.]|nr:type II toxin-antitoxin system VapC family toxin [Nitrososphaera sp.]
DLSRFSVLNLDYESARIWGELAERTKSNSIGELDLFIASIAIANKQTLLTRNIKHYERVSDLTVESW